MVIEAHFDYFFSVKQYAQFLTKPWPFIQFEYVQLCSCTDLKCVKYPIFDDSIDCYRLVGIILQLFMNVSHHLDLLISLTQWEQIRLCALSGCESVIFLDLLKRIRQFELG